MEFFREGTVIITGEGRATTAYYEFVEEDALKIEPKFRFRDSESDSRIVKVSITQDRLTIGDAGSNVTFERQK